MLAKGLLLGGAEGGIHVTLSQCVTVRDVDVLVCHRPVTPAPSRHAKPSWKTEDEAKNVRLPYPRSSTGRHSKSAQRPLDTLCYLSHRRKRGGSPVGASSVR
eukprot:1271398-Pyramimonas_sp.AAC.1